MADANIKVDPKQLKNYSNNIKTGYKNSGKEPEIHLDGQRLCRVLQSF